MNLDARTLSRGAAAVFALAIAQCAAPAAQAADYDVGPIHIAQPGRWRRQKAPSQVPPI